jgi:hypothetical protein
MMGRAMSDDDADKQISQVLERPLPQGVAAFLLFVSLYAKPTGAST